MINKYKNINDIKLANGQIRGEVFSDSDLNLIWLDGQQSEYIDASGKPYIIESFDDSARNTVELTVYDLDDNILYWNTVSPPIPTYNGTLNTIVLSPGDDLRAAGLSRGQFRINYELYRDALGSANGNKLYIEEISPSRREVRARPIKIADAEQNGIFNQQMIYFSDNGVPKNQFIATTNRRVTATDRDQIIQDTTSTAYLALTDAKIIQLHNSTVKFITRTTREYDADILVANDQHNIIEGSIDNIVNETFDTDQVNETTDTTEIKIAWKRILKSFVSVDNHSGNIEYYLNFGNNNTYVVVNWLRDKNAYPEYPYSIVFKLYEPLPEGVKEKQEFWVSRQITTPVIENVFMFGLEDESERGLVLRPANFDINVGPGSGRGVGYQTWTQLISTQPSTSQAILDHYISSSDAAGDIKLNIDYSNYGNFIHFGSAAERLRNFKYKLELIDTYNDNIARLHTYAGSLNSIYTSGSVDGFITKIRQVKNGFDQYERHLYYVSGSQYSGSLVSNGEALINSINEWPKQNNSIPYALYPTTSSIASSWYNDQLTIAQRFDNDNYNSFVNNLPAYITVDENNEDYLNFVYMIGQHFDTVFTYIKQLTLISNRDESTYTGLAKDLTYHVAGSMGFDMWNGNDNVDLWQWVFGYNQTGSFSAGTVSGSGETNLSKGDVSKEIWRRILNNLPYLLKTKGTSRSLKALFACYGIPTSLLSIREYGGPDPRDYEGLQNKSAYIFEDYVYSIDFHGSQSVSNTWAALTSSLYPQTIEFRFASAPTIHAPSSSVGLGDGKVTQSLVATDDWAINLVNSGSGFGYIQFAINDGAIETSIKTNKYRYYDNEFNSVMLRYSASSANSYFELWTKKAESDRIIFYSSASLLVNTNISASFFADSTLYIGGDVSKPFGEQFTGSMQEYKLYQYALSESAFDNHVRWPKAYNATNVERTYHDLVLRYSFDEPKNHNSDGVVSDVKANQTYTTPGTANVFDSEINYTARTEEFAALSPNIGSGRFINNKIRLEDNELTGDLNPRKRIELGGYDRAPNDSAKLGVYFSPLDAINNDITATYAGLDLGGKIGDPRDEFTDTYRDLTELQWQYFKKYKTPPQFNDFIRTVKQFDQSFFNQLRSLLPARSKPLLGLLIEPNILERHKVKHQQATHERNDYQTNTIETQTYLTQSWETSDLQTTIELTWTNVSEYFYQEAVASIEVGDPTEYFTGEQQYIPMLNSIQDLDDGTYTIRKVYTTISSSIEGAGLKYTRIPTTGRKKDYYEVFDLKPGNWLLGIREESHRMYYGGTLNTLSTTIDGKEPVEISYTNPNKLKTTDRGPSRIRVE